MKKVFVLALTLVLGLGIFAFAGPFSGSWESELTIGFRDVVVTDPGTTITVAGGTYDVSQGLVTIPSKTVTINVQGQNIPLTVPGGTYICNGSLTIPGGTYDVTDGTISIPSQTVTVDLPDSTATCTVPGYTFEISDFLNKDCTPHWDMDYNATVELSWHFGGIEPYTVEVISGTPYDSDSGVTTVPPQDGDYGTFDFCTLEFATDDAIATQSFSRNIQVPIGSGLYETVTFSFNVPAYTPTHDDYVNGKTFTLTATATDSIGRTWEATITVDLEFDLTNEVRIPAAIGATCTYDGKTLTFELPNDLTLPIDMPSGWPFAAGTYTAPNNCGPRPTVSVSFDGQGWVYEGTDLMGPCLLSFPSTTLEIDDSGVLSIDLVGDARFATFEDGTEVITLPDRTVTCTIAGQSVDVTIPGQSVTVSGQTVTIPDQNLNFSGQVTIPDYTTTITVDGQTIDVTVPGGTYTVSDQTVTIPDQTITIPGWSQTIEKVPTLGFTSTLIVDYTVGGWTFESKSKFDETGWTEQSFTADGTLGAFTLKSKLVFDPAGASFTYWDNTGSVSIAGVDLSGEFKLTSSGSGWKFGASGSAGDLSLSGTAYFNLDSDGNVGDSYCFCFDKVKFDASFPFACIEEVGLSVSFSDTGFDGVTFSASNAAVPGIAWLSFDFDLTFDDGVTGKSLSITPNINLGDFSCITLYYDLSTSDDLIIDGIYFYGLGLSYTWNGVTFSNTTAFDTSDPKDLVKDPYWEVFTIKSAADSCCGGAFDFSIDTYFDASSGMLFDWGESDVKVSIGLGSNYTGWMGLGVKDTGFDSWTIGFKVTW